MTAIGTPQAAASIRAAIVGPVPGVKPTGAGFG
jgi:hypothetical protein